MIHRKKQSRLFQLCMRIISIYLLPSLATGFILPPPNRRRVEALEREYKTII